MIKTKRLKPLAVFGVLVVAVLAAWVADAERRADWPSAARALADAIDTANKIDARRQSLETVETFATLVGNYMTATAKAEQERYAAAEGMTEPFVEVGDFHVTAYLVPGDGGPNDRYGYPLHHGVVATDPAVIPTGALIYIPALREFDRLYAPVYRISKREFKRRVAGTAIPAGTAAPGPDDAGGVDDGWVFSCEARGGGWFVARDVGPKVKGNTIDVAVFGDQDKQINPAYRYIADACYASAAARKMKKTTVKVYRQRYAKEWGSER